MDIHDRVSELDATRGQETAILECPPFQVLHDQEVDASGGHVRGTDAMKGTEC